MKQTTLAIFLILVSLGGIFVVNAAYVIDEREQVVITEFGRPVGEPHQKPGLHFKVPFIQEVHKFDKRILNWDGYPSEIPTRDKKFIWVDITGRWQIKDPLVFFQTMHDEQTAQSRLDDIMDGITRNFITRYNLVDVVRSTNDILEGHTTSTSDESVVSTEYEKIEVGRDEITRQILESAKKVILEYGIELIDLRIKRINYIQTVQEKVFERMIAERNRAAEQLRSEGQGIRAEVEGQKEKELKRLTSEAYKQAQTIKGQGDAEATSIYGKAFSANPEFYAFMTTLEKYPGALKDGRIVLSTNSDFLKYLKSVDK